MKSSTFNLLKLLIFGIIIDIAGFLTKVSVSFMSFSVFVVLFPLMSSFPLNTFLMCFLIPLLLFLYYSFELFISVLEIITELLISVPLQYVIHHNMLQINTNSVLLNYQNFALI